MMSDVSGSVAYRGNYVSFPAPTLSAPPEGNRTIPVDIVWISAGGPNNTIHFNARSQQVQEISQIAGLHVDNTRCRGTVTIIFPDTGFEVVLGGTFEGYYPVVTNSLEFFISLSVIPTVQDETILQVLNFIPPPITFGTAPAGQPPVGSVSEVDSGPGLTGGPITTVGTLSLQRPVTVGNGGTSASTGNGALDNLAGVSGAQAGFISRSTAGSYGLAAAPLSVGNGGTGAVNGPAGLDNLAGISSGSGSLGRTAGGSYNLTAYPLATTLGGTGVNNIPAGNLVGGGGVGNPVVPVPTPLAVGYGGTGSASFAPTGALLLGSGNAAVRASQLMTQTSDAVGLQMRSAGGVGTAGSPYFDMFWAPGSVAAPSPTPADGNLGGVYAGGADSNGWSDGGETAVLFWAGGNWTPTSHPTRITFGTTIPGMTLPGTRLHIRQGLTLPNAAGVDPADMGQGTLNCAAGVYVNGATPGGGYPVSWLAGVNPNHAVILIAERAMTITAIFGVVRVASGGTATVDVTNGAGTRVNSITLNANATGFLNMGVALTTLAAQDYLVLQTAGTAWTAGIGNITVYVA